MSRAIRAAATFLVLATSLSAAEFGGTVYDDPPALALPMHFQPAAGVTVRLYADDGDRIPTAGDRLSNTTRTDAAGRYRFTAAAGAYWIAVDSRSIRNGTWSEQTWGPSGALCAQQDGSTRMNNFSGSCFGGRFAAASDDASALPTSDHVAFAPSPATDLDFAFSLNAVTTIDDDGQGSLRQFVRNANAVPGPNVMRFVPLSRPQGRWWTIQLKTPLPAIADATVIDGTARNFLSAATPIDTNPGRFGELPHVTGDEQILESLRQSKPELEIVATGDEGITCNAHCTIRNLALHGARVSIVTRADSIVEEVILGARPDVVPIIAPGEAGLQVEKGTAAARLVYVTRQSVAGIAAAAPGARVEGERLTITRCGTPTSGAAIALISDRSTIRLSDITGNEGAGIILGTPDGAQGARENTIEGCTISGNLAGVVLTPGASRNRIEKNDIVWNRNGGVVNVAPPAGPAPAENRISANRFNENGARPIELTREAPAALSCERVESAPNRGITPPVVESARIVDDRVHIRGRACPGQLVEIYQSFLTADAPAQTASLRTTDERVLPSVGEFNYIATTTAHPDGTFELSLPAHLLPPPADSAASTSSAEAVAWSEIAPFETNPASRAYAALAIDAQGNTSELGGRRGVEP